MNDNPCVDRYLLERAMEVGGEPDASAVLTRALEEFIASHSPNAEDRGSNEPRPPDIPPQAAGSRSH
jgi:hypothetical protein